MNPSQSNNHLFPVFLFLFLVVLAAWHPVVDHDFGFNVASGQEVVSSGKVPEIDTLSVAGEGKPWINRLWGFQVTLYFFHEHFHFFGVSLLTTLCTGGAFAFLFFSVRDKENPFLIYIFLLVLFIVQTRLRARPEIFTFFFLSSVTYLLERFQRKDGPIASTVFLIPLIQLLWVNVHGLFVLGIILQIILWVSWIVEKPVSRYCLIQRSHPGEKKKRILLSIILLSCLVSLVNPFGLQGLLVPFEQFKMLGTESFFSNLTELVPFYQVLPGLWKQEKLYVIAVLLFLFFSLRPFWKPKQGLPLYRFLVFISFFYLALKANRNVALFVLAAAPAVCDSRMAIKGLKGGGRLLRRGIPVIVLIGLIVSRFIPPLSSSFFFLYPFGQGVYPLEKFAIRPVHFMITHKIPGPVFPTDLRDGNLLLWKGMKPVYDGRLEIFGEEFFRQYHQETIVTKENFETEIEKYRVNAVLVRHYIDNRYPTIVRFIPQRIHDLFRNPRWDLVYLDSSFCLFIRNNFSNRDIIKKYRFDIRKKKALERIMAPTEFYHANEKGKYLKEISRLASMLITLGALNNAKRIALAALKTYPHEEESAMIVSKVREAERVLSKAMQR